MGYGINLRVFGDYACFTRPEMKVERVSYDVITPSAARGIIEAIFWKPSITWIIDEIRVLNKIEFTNIRRNEVGERISRQKVAQAMRGSTENLYLDVTQSRQQRAALILKNVEYIISAHFELNENADENESSEKFYNMAIRRMTKGQTFNQPYLGTREFSCGFEYVEKDSLSSFTSFYEDEDEIDLGWMLYDIDFSNDMKPIFYRATMNNGVISVSSAIKAR
jgi:CRISPR-associated protein Cas5d